jgi:poly-gamma-glutamate synthesis protein (capsule biosynthesis protein)
MLFVGDVNFARSLARDFLFAGRGDEVFRPVRERLRAADLAIANLESMILDRGDHADPPGSPTFAGPLEAVPLLVDAGFDAVSTANNHAWDFGRAGVLENLEHLRHYSLPRTGTGASAEEAWRPALLRSGAWTVAVFGLTYIINHPTLTVRGTPAECCIAWADTVDATRWFRYARDSLGADLVIATVHQGWVEYRAVPDAQTVRLFRGLARAGADAVIGHHPHVPQGWELVDGRPVVYSLGNFVFRQARPWTNRGLVAELVVAPGGAMRLALHPVAAGYVPSFLAGRDSAAVMAHLDSISRRIGLPNPEGRRNVARSSAVRETR